MILLEQKSKDILSKEGINVPKGQVVQNEDELSEVQSFPVAIKAQVPAWSRKAKGGISFASDESELKQYCREMFQSTIDSQKVTKLLIEEKLDIAAEYYFSISVNRANKNYVALFSVEGGSNIEEIPRGRINRVFLNPLIGIQPFMKNILFKGTESPVSQIRAELDGLLEKSYRALLKYDAKLLEINPLALTRSNKLIAVDAKIVVDDAAIFRQKGLGGSMEGTDFERVMRKAGANAVELGEGIALVTSGAGLGLATIDSLNSRGVQVGYFVDLGGRVFSDLEQLKRIVRNVRDVQPERIFFNFFFQLADCRLLAIAIRDGLSSSFPPERIIVRLKGQNSDEARSILQEANFGQLTESFEEACEMIAASK